MGGQMQELLIEVSRNLAVVERLLEEVKESQKEQSEHIIDLRERVAGLERDREWSGEERRDVHGRLETGDWTFKRIEQKAEEAERTAEHAVQVAKDALGAIDAHTSGSHGEKTKRRGSRFWTLVYKLLPYVVPPLISGLAWLFLHIRIASEISTHAVKVGHP